MAQLTASEVEQLYWRPLECGCPAGVVADEDHQEGCEQRSPGRRGRMWAELAALIAGGLPAPSQMSVQTPEGREGTVQVFMEPDRADVDAWAEHLGVTAQLGEHVHRNRTRTWRAYKAVKADPWPGFYQVEVWCAVEVPAEGGGS